MKTTAFSLIELMVVVAIIAILATVAVPAYKDYLLKQKIASYIPILQSAAGELEIKYATTGSFPDTYTFYGVTLNILEPSLL